MNVWELRVEFGAGGKAAFAMLRTTTKEDNSLFFNRFNGESFLPAEWKPVPLVRNPVNKKEAISQELGDWACIDSYGGILNLSQKALDMLFPHIALCGEVLPVVFDEAPFAIFNVTNVVDALNESASEIKYFPPDVEDGRVMRIVQFVFKPEAVNDQWIFKIPQLPGTHNFVTDRFVKVVQDAGLRGFGFTKVWSDDKDWEGSGPSFLELIGNRNRQLAAK